MFSFPSSQLYGEVIYKAILGKVHVELITAPVSDLTKHCVTCGHNLHI